MSRLVFREAGPEDDAQLTQLIATPMPGDLSLSFQRRPSYLQACSLCGPPRRVLVALEGEQLVALTSFFSREYWWDGQFRSVWILSDFRALPQRAGFGITGQGWKALRTLLDDKPALLSVVEDNSRALSLFCKPRPGWPRLHPVAQLRTNLTPIFGWRTSFSHRYRVLRLDPDTFLQACSQTDVPLYPKVERADLEPFGSDLWGVFEGERLLGFAGLLDQSRHRQVVIHAYHGWYQKLYRLGCRLGLPLLPPPGSQVKHGTVGLLHCPDPAAWSALKSTLQTRAGSNGARFLVWCRAGRNPWNLSFTYRSRLFQILWEGENPLPTLAKSSADPLSFEVSWL